MAGQERSQASATWTGDVDGVKGKLILAATPSQCYWQHCFSKLPCPLSPQQHVPAHLPQYMAITVQLKQVAGPGWTENPLYCENTVLV